MQGFITSHQKSAVCFRKAFCLDHSEENSRKYCALCSSSHLLGRLGLRGRLVNQPPCKNSGYCLSVLIGDPLGDSPGASGRVYDDSRRVTLDGSGVRKRLFLNQATHLSLFDPVAETQLISPDEQISAEAVNQARVCRNAKGSFQVFLVGRGCSMLVWGIGERRTMDSVQTHGVCMCVCVCVCMCVLLFG